MKAQLRLVLLMGALALASLPAVGCGGPECGDGTTEKDGKCVAEAGGEGGITCGAGTVEENGACVPSETVSCGPKTTEDDQGRCVIAPDACEDGATLDPNTGNCVAGTAECGEGTAIDGNTGTCVPTADVCDEGTVFDDASGLCLPGYACSVGDVIVDGVCASPAEELAASADLTEAENNDPALGGTAQALTLKGPGSATVFTGTIGAPEDLDEDGELDQDVDVYTFEASAGDWFELSVQSTGAVSPVFFVEGPNGYFRVSPAIAGPGSARQLLLPADGTYSITVLPLSVFYTDFPAGGDEWGYVGSLKQIDTPAPSAFNLNADTLTGDFGSLSDHYYSVTGYDAGDLVTVTIESSEDGADGVFSMWNSATDFAGNVEFEAGDTFEMVIPPSGELLIAVDWSFALRTDATFEISSERADNFEAIGTIENDGSASSTPTTIGSAAVQSYTFSVSAGQVIEISHFNVEGDAVDISLRDVSGNVYINEAYTSLTRYRYHYTETGGTFILELDNSGFSSSPLTDAKVTINTLTPNDLGAAGVGDTVSASVTDELQDGRSDFHILTLNENVTLTGDVTTPNDEDVDVYILDAAGEQVNSFVTTGAETITGTLVAAGTMLLQVSASELISSYDVNLAFAEAPSIEVEPNETIATATAFDLSKAMVGVSSDSDDVDVFSFSPAADMGADEVLILKLEQDSSGTDEYICTIRDSSGNPLGINHPEGVEEGCVSMAANLLASETYYLEIVRDYASYSNPSKGYTITPSVETGVLEVEPNETDTEATSVDLTALIGGAGAFGMLPSDTDVDYFTFDLAADQASDEMLKFSISRLGTNPTFAASWRLLDSSLAEVAAAGIDGQLMVSGLTQGTYYLELTRSNSTSYNSLVYQIVAEETVSVCGNGVLEPGEMCDGAPRCTNTCEWEPGFVSASDTTSGVIADNDSAGHVAKATIAGCVDPISEVSVDVNITHGWRGDLVVDLISPQGTTVRLHDGSGGSASDLVGNYPADLTVEGPGTLADFVGEDANGEWQLYAADTAGGIAGMFNSFSVYITCD
ncbi:proprotein convertase P-domain-containing protein [Bradymonas sediminis]|nr:proprotein convertase P-domain-containing protein [Bradymonas sediminis]TDP62368.1 proprotein convertase P-domain-containing protein [Bradymonas sediminis]